MEDQKGCIRECEEFKYLGVKFMKRKDKKIILRTGLIKVELKQQCSKVYCGTQKTIKNNLQMYNWIVKSTITYRAETWRLNKNLEWKTYVEGNALFEEIGRYSRL